jgi:hypothetical protein
LAPVLPAIFESLDKLKFPLDAFVIGEPVRVTAIEHSGDARRGFFAVCRRAERDYQIGLAEVVFEPRSVAQDVSNAYRSWLGLVPHGVVEPPRRHKAASTDLDLSRDLELVVLATKSNALRCRVLGTQREVTLRTPVRDEISGEIITVAPSKQWTHAGHPYLSGAVKQRRLDVAALGLAPLELRAGGDWDPAHEYWGEQGEPLPRWAEAIVKRGQRPAFEMGQVIPGEDPDDADWDPIIEASELREAGKLSEAFALLNSILARDLRCLDAHAHLGNAHFDFLPKLAQRHYQVGVAIGEQALGPDFDSVLPWGLVNNRPFLRCLFGLGLSFWKLGNFEEALAAFTRLLWLNPSDNQGARFNLADAEAGHPWTDSEA